MKLNLVRIMKLSFLLLFVCVFQMLATNGNAQNAVVNLFSNQLTVAQLIEEIEKQTDYLVVYSNSEMDTRKNLTLKNKSAKVSDILQEAFGREEMKYEFDNNYIILSKRAITLNNQQAPGKRITGTVVDDKGESIIGASIAVKGTTTGTVTDVGGNFSITAASNVVLVISYIGFKTQEVAVGNQTRIAITLEENSRELEEVVVTALGMKRSEKALGYAVQRVSGDLETVKGVNVANSLTGKVSGMTIFNSQEFMAAPRITLRDENPILVLDGIHGV